MTKGQLALTASGSLGTVYGAGRWLWYAVRDPGCHWLGSPVCKGAVRPSIALTFDDGPSESTLRLVDILQRYEVAATFFQCGLNVRRLPEVTAEISRAGHEIANHTYSHPRLLFRSSHFMYQEMAATQEIIYETTGARPAWFRPPFGLRWFGLEGVTRQLSLKTALWSTIGMDWTWPADAVVDTVLHGLENGAIVCLHDGRRLRRGPDIDVTLQAVQRIVPRALDLGYRFETLSSLTVPSAELYWTDDASCNG
jgi:peptidoglycan/xylan/chitin deacetylase (PgdA/CDA1 family)